MKRQGFNLFKKADKERTLEMCRHYPDDPSEWPKILVVDDEVDYTELVKMNLESACRYRVNCINDPKLAVPLAVEWRPDIVLLDDMMPEMGGFQVYKTIRTTAEIKDTPVIMISASYRKHDLQKELQGDHDHMMLTKPLKLEEMVTAIEAELNNTRGSG